MKVFVGYQEDVDPGTKELHLDPNKSFFELSEDIAQFGKRYTIDHFDDPIDKNKWSGSAFDINAFTTQKVTVSTSRLVFCKLRFMTKPSTERTMVVSVS